MKKIIVRRGSLIIAILLIVISVIVNNNLSESKETPEKKEFSTESPLVKVYESESSITDMNIQLNGRLSAVNKVDIYGEVSGRVLPAQKVFKDGVQFNKGETLFKLNNQTERLGIVANRSSFLSVLTGIQAELAVDYAENFENWNTYVRNFDPEKNLVNLPTVSNEKEKKFLIQNIIFI